MSWMNRLEPPEDDYLEEEWAEAEEALREERRELGWSESEIDAGVDYFLIAEACDARREDRASVWADEARARRKEDRWM